MSRSFPAASFVASLCSVSIVVSRFESSMIGSAVSFPMWRASLCLIEAGLRHVAGRRSGSHTPRLAPLRPRPVHVAIAREVIALRNELLRLRLTILDKLVRVGVDGIVAPRCDRVI